MRHVGGDFAGREAELAVEQLVDVAQRVGEGVPQPPAGGAAVRLVRQRPLQPLLFLRASTRGEEVIDTGEGIRADKWKVDRGGGGRGGGALTHLEQLLEVLPPLPRQEAAVCVEEVLKPATERRSSRLRPLGFGNAV